MPIANDTGSTIAPPATTGRKHQQKTSEGPRLLPLANDPIEAKKRQDKRQKRYEKPIWRPVVGLLFAWLLIITVGLALLSLGKTELAVPLAGTLYSLLMAALLPGVPLLAVCAVQLVRIGRGRCEEEPRLYRVCGIVCLAVLVGLLAAWVITLLLGV